MPRLPTASPTILSPAELNITAKEHGEVVLPCRVVNIGSGSVTWLRWPQLTLLSSGDTVFTSSTRVTLLHSRHVSPDYNLRIFPVLRSDQGQYRCQLNTEDNQVSLVNLEVGEIKKERPSRPGPLIAGLHSEARGDTLSSTKILSDDLVRVEPGGVVTLHCLVSHSILLSPPHFITWLV